MLTLYYTPTSCATASHIALEESGIAYEAIRVKMHKPEEHQRYKDQVNPLGTVPALLTDAGLLTENLAIMSYVACLAPARQLLPESPWALGQCLAFMGWLASSVQIARRQFRKPAYFADDEAVYPVLERVGAARFRDCVARIDQRFADTGPWVAGDHYSVADGYALVIYHWAVLDGLDMDQFPGFTAHKQRLLQRPAVQTVLQRERCILLDTGSV